MSKRNQLMGLARLGALALLAVAGITLTAIPSAASDAITLSQLAGSWQIALYGNTGCGATSMLVNVTLSASGSGSATTTYHSGCGDNTASGLPFTITTLNANGSGTAGLSCGSGCGWVFNIQVSSQKDVFNLVDVDPSNPGNYVQGTAIKQE
jgi:hypothetical protein